MRLPCRLHEIDKIIGTLDSFPAQESKVLNETPDKRAYFEKALSTKSPGRSSSKANLSRLISCNTYVKTAKWQSFTWHESAFSKNQDAGKL